METVNFYLSVPKSKAYFFSELLKEFNFVKFEEEAKMENKALFFENLKNAVNEVRQHKEEKIELQMAKDFLDEL